MDGVQAVSVHLYWIVPLVLLIVFLASPRFRGDIAETRVRRILAAGLEKNRYTLLNDLVIPSGGGTIHIDHMVISKFGIFVIESQHARGWVSGAEFQDRWKQYHLRRFTLFDNPLHRNHLQVQALENLLKLPPSKLHSIVVLVGNKGLKTRMPMNVLQPEKLISHIRKSTDHLLSADQAAQVLQKVEDARVKMRDGLFVNQWSLLRVVLLFALLAGGYFAFRDDITDFRKELAAKKAQKTSPENFHPDGRPKSESELWEDSLTCAWSADTGRCSCYEPDGSKARIEAEKCRSLAERGSVLKQ